MKNLKQIFIQKWVKFLTLILGVLGFAACNHETGDDDAVLYGPRLAQYGPNLYGCPPIEYKTVDLTVKGNITNDAQQNIKSTIIVKVTEDGENYIPYTTIKTNESGFYEYRECFTDECLGVRFVIQDDKNYYLSDSVDVKFVYPEEGEGYQENKEFNFTLTPRIPF